MGATYSNGCSHYEYGFPPRKRRMGGGNGTPESALNHFDKNYLIEGSEFWSEKRYREDCYMHTAKMARIRNNSSCNSENVYRKVPTEYFWSSPTPSTTSSTSSSSSSFTSSASPQNSSYSSSLPKQQSCDLWNRPAPLIARKSLQNMAMPHSSAMAANKATSCSSSNTPHPHHRPPGIQAKYLPNFG